MQGRSQQEGGGSKGCSDLNATETFSPCPLWGSSCSLAVVWVTGNWSPGALCCPWRRANTKQQGVGCAACWTAWISSVESLRQCSDPTDQGSAFAGSICCTCQQNHWLEPDGHEIPVATFNSALLCAPAEQRRAVPTGPSAWSSCFPQSSLDLEVKLSWGAVHVAVSNSPYLHLPKAAALQPGATAGEQCLILLPWEVSISFAQGCYCSLHAVCLRLLFLKVPS